MLLNMRRYNYSSYNLFGSFSANMLQVEDKNLNRLPHYQFHDQVDHTVGVQQFYKQSNKHFQYSKPLKSRDNRTRPKIKETIQYRGSFSHTVNSAPQAMSVT